MITVVGSLNMDLVVNTERIPRPGETVLGRGFKQVPGGKGGNQAAAAAKLGGEVAMIGAVGDDPMGRTLTESLARDCVDVSHILVKEEVSTGIASIVVEDSGNNAITVAPGANFAITPEEVEAMSGIITGSDVVLAQLENPLPVVSRALEIARAAGRTTILNPAPAVEISDELLALADILTPNETELERLSGYSTDGPENVGRAARALMDRGAKEILVTLGDVGCTHFYQDDEGTVTRQYFAYPVFAVDTTAAGDCFNGALALALDRGESMSSAIHFAMKAAALAVKKEGAQTSLPTREEMENFEHLVP